MLQTFYNNFGFAGSIAISFVAFIVFIFWMAGISGIVYEKDEGHKTLKVVLAILLPPYPLIWLFMSMYKESQLMKEND